MGWNTTILLMNDGLYELARDPHAGEKIRDAVLQHSQPDYHFGERVNSFGIGSHVNMGQVIASEHADTDQVLLVGQNLGRNVGSCYEMPDPADLKALANVLERHGWRCKPPKKEG